MTNDQVLAICRSNWEYRGLSEASVREMLDELSTHLDDAEAAGRTARDVVGEDVRAFAATWARARAPLYRRVLRTAAMASLLLGVLVLLTCLVRWTPERDVEPNDFVFYAVLALVTVGYELRRGGMGLGRSWGLAFLVGVPAIMLSNWLIGDDPLFTVPFWAGFPLLLPALPYVVDDIRHGKGAVPVAE
ncbi:hypothetical protein LRS74_16020 [Streptomyces sp. LX-29]|uniref:hypothetical protein n=1 Tax=Streptomyces sp. LX-29 TaxID=2900152 RepID=UPI00240E8DAE|nr:hypothetical protein [Streptomyces sp. LX-29]WFB08389.1 hypothetical protein LRS74_16020 [Streptomyces sp. LX-29]